MIVVITAMNLRGVRESGTAFAVPTYCFMFGVLGMAAWAVVNPSGLAGLNNSGPHGLGEILYAFSSATGNNGSAFAGLSANTPWYNTTLGLAMLGGRYLMIIPIMARSAPMRRALSSR